MIPSQVYLYLSTIFFCCVTPTSGAPQQNEEWKWQQTQTCFETPKGWGQVHGTAFSRLVGTPEEFPIRVMIARLDTLDANQIALLGGEMRPDFGFFVSSVEDLKEVANTPIGISTYGLEAHERRFDGTCKFRGVVIPVSYSAVGLFHPERRAKYLVSFICRRGADRSECETARKVALSVRSCIIKHSNFK